MQTETNETNNTSYPQLERDYDVAVPQIQCEADACWKLLPRNFKVAFVKLKGQCFWWLRKHAPKAQSSQLKP